MEYKSLKIDSDSYEEKEVFEEIRFVFDKMDTLVYNKKFADAIVFGMVALKKFKNNKNIDVIYRMICDAIARVTLENMREVK